MNAIETIFKRRSIRSYKDTPVEEEIIKIILETAMAAPTAVNAQPWEFIVVTDPEKLATVRKTAIFARYNAPVAIVVCEKYETSLSRPRTGSLDPGLQRWD